MENLVSPEKKALRRIILIFATGFFLVAAVVVGTLSFLIHRTHKYVKELSVYPQNYVLFYEKDSFRPPPDNIISPAQWQRFLVTQEILEKKIEKLKTAGRFNPSARGNETVAQVQAVREMEMAFFKEQHQSIRAFKWIAFQVLVAAGGRPLRRYAEVASHVPLAKTIQNPVSLLYLIPEENLRLFNKDGHKLALFHNLWLTAL